MTVWPESGMVIDQPNPGRIFRGGHPATYSRNILRALNSRIIRERRPDENQPLRVLDPFGGVGTIHELATELVHTFAVEIEKKWFLDAQTKYPDRITVLADSVQWAEMLVGRRMFDVLATSPVYPNGMADRYVGDGKTPRNTYASHLGQNPTEGSSAGLGRWSSASARGRHLEFNQRAFDAFVPLIRPGGLVLLNVKDPTWTVDSVRQVGPFSASMWAMLTERHGLILEGLDVIPTRGRPSGKHAAERTGFEYVLAFRVP